MNDRKPIIHDLKCWPGYFEAVARNEKTFEIRKWDRPYRVGDTLWLREWDNEKIDYTGRSIYRTITYLLDMTYLPGDNIPHFAHYVAIGLDNPALLDHIEQLQSDIDGKTATIDLLMARLDELQAELARAVDEGRLVEVVRCKDCYKRDKSWCPAYGGMRKLYDTDFCSYGERR